MRPRLFHTIVLVGASLTGTVGLATVPAVLGLSGCSDEAGDCSMGSCDAGVLDGGSDLAFGTVDLAKRD